MASHYTPETRASVMAALLAGQGVSELAREYQIPESTVSRWKKAAREEAGLSGEIGELLLDYLGENLRTLKAQAVAFRDTDWIRKQSASELGVLHGILSDKAVRLLEALEGSPVEPRPGKEGRRQG